MHKLGRVREINSSNCKSILSEHEGLNIPGQILPRWYKKGIGGFSEILGIKMGRGKAMIQQEGQGWRVGDNV